MKWRVQLLIHFQRNFDIFLGVAQDVKGVAQDDSHFVNFFQAASMALRLLATTSLVETASNAGSFSFREEGRLGFLLKTSRLELNPWTTWSVFWALIVHAYAISKLQCVSSELCFTIPPSIQLCRLFNIFSAGVVYTMIFKFCAVSRNDRLLNSLPLSVRMDPGVSKYVIKCLNIRGSLNKFPDFFRMGTFIDSTHMKL